VYAGGGFTTAGGNEANYIAKWDGSAWSSLSSGMGRTDTYLPYVRALAAAGGDLYAGGDFTTAGEVAANHIAKWDGSVWGPLGQGMPGGDQYTTVFALAMSGSNVYAGGNFTNADGSAAINIARWDGRAWSPLGSGMNNPVYAL